MLNQYYNIWNNNDILETDAEFKKKSVSYKQMKEDLFYGRGVICDEIQRIGNGTFLNKILYKNQTYNFLFVNVKNSGMMDEKYRKRLQISNQINFNNDSSIYAIGAYNVGNKRLYCCMNLTDFVKRAISGKSYSSFWIDYYQLKKTNEKNQNTWRDQKNRVISCFSSDILKSFDDDMLLQKILIDDENTLIIDDDVKILDPNLEIFDEKIHSYKHKLLPRNHSLKEKALIRANYICELCGKEKTFSTIKDDQYFEGHHLIMYNLGVQKRYKYCLDNIENIVCLCPTCHKKIHLANLDERKQCVIKLLLKHRTLIDLFEITDIEPIINDYIEGVEDDG